MSDSTAMPETRMSSVLQTSSQALVVAAGLVYLFGFIVVSVFDATYGIADFSLFRTKVIAVGTLFVFLLVLPVIVTFRMFGIFGLGVKHTVFPAAVTPKSQTFHAIDVGLYIPFACVGIAWLVFFLFTPAAITGWRPAGFSFVPLTLILAIVGVWGHKRFDSYPLIFVTISFLASVALFIILFKYSARSFFWTVTWFTVISLTTLFMRATLRDREKVRSTQWERLFLFFVPLIVGLYAFEVYPNIRHEFGGGAPVPVILHLTKKLPVFDSESVPVSLIDETEQGYYVIRGADKAVFVARGLVEEVEFLRTDANPKKP